MYDLVGDKIQAIFDAQVVDIGMFDREAGLVRFPYIIERGVRFDDLPVPIGPTQEEFIRNRTTLARQPGCRRSGSRRTG